jgi:hypothetical protein
VTQGCTILLSHELDNVYKIDALIEEIEGYGPFPPIAAQLTLGKDNTDKIRAFLTEAAKWSNVGALLYVEIDGAVSDAMCRTFKDALVETIKEIKRNRGKTLSQRRIRIYESGEFQWIPLGQN